jgi:hypothetical protein
MFTILLIVGLVTFLLWLIAGVAFHAIPGDLVTACLILWIVCAVGLLVLGIMGHGRLGW